jgi:hypothetical protein
MMTTVLLHDLNIDPESDVYFCMLLIKLLCAQEITVLLVLNYESLLLRPCLPPYVHSHR